MTLFNKLLHHRFGSSPLILVPKRCGMQEETVTMWNAENQLDHVLDQHKISYECLERIDY